MCLGPLVSLAFFAPLRLTVADAAERPTAMGQTLSEPVVDKVRWIAEAPPYLAFGDLGPPTLSSSRRRVVRVGRGGGQIEPLTVNCPICDHATLSSRHWRAQRRCGPHHSCLDSAATGPPILRPSFHDRKHPSTSCLPAIASSRPQTPPSPQRNPMLTCLPRTTDL